MASRKLTLKPEGYDEFVGELQERIRQAQLKAAQAVGRGLVQLYWGTGKAIVERQERAGWGAKVLERVSADLRRTFPEMRGFSVRNLRYMMALAREWPDGSIVQQLLHSLPWFHTCALLEKVKEPQQRLWYAPQSDLAREVLKDPYKLDFLGLGTDAAEREIQRALARHVREFLLELGQGFAFIGERYPIEVGGERFEMDLLFYHLDLRSFFVIELKGGRFRPADTGQLNFYLSAVDDLLRRPGDNPTIGMVLCRDKNNVVAEYALRGTSQPIGVSEFELTKALPESLQGKLPAVEELEAELEDNSDENPEHN